jgi:hypothetical protein
MQLNLGTYLETVLDSRTRDLFAVYEIYASDYDSTDGFDPRDAERTFAGFTYVLPFGPVTYKRQVKTTVTIDKTIKKQINSITIGFSNVDDDIDGFRYMARYVNSNTVEGKKLVVRVLSYSASTTIGDSIAVLANSIILFAGRCDKPDAFNREKGSISAKQDFGTIEALIPRYQFQQHCPVKFKGPECLGTELLSEKSAEFQAGTVCNKTFEKCTFYSNTEFFQGTRIVQITSSFVNKHHQGFFSKLLEYGGFGLIGRLLAPKRQSVTVNNSTHDGTPYGNPIPVILGRWYKSLIALQFQDIGTSINFKMAACRGKIHDFINVRNESEGFTQPIGVTKHLGEYGGDGSQTADTVFPDHSFHSRLAYLTGYCNGSDIETEDPAPVITSVVAGIIPDQIYFDVDHDGTGKLSAGTGGVTSPGASVTPPAAPAASFDDAIFEIGTPEFYFKTLETTAGNVYPTPTGGMIDSSGNGNHAWYIDAGNGGPPTLNINSPEVPVETDSASRFASGPVGFLPAPSGSPLDPRGNQTWVAIARITSHTAQSYIFNRGSDTSGGVPFGLSFGSGLGSDTIVANWGNGAIQEPGEGDGQLTYGPVPEDGTPCLIVSVREETSIKLYFNGCLVDQDVFPAGDIVFSDFNNSPWRFGYTPNLVFGPVEQSQGESRMALYNGIAATAEQVSRLWASMKTIPTGCPGEDWTDNPVDHVRYLLTEPAALNIPEGMIDDFESAYAAAYNCGAIKDETNAERALLPNTEVTRAGTDYRRYTSTGLLGPQSFESSRTQIPAGVPARALVNVGSGGDAIGEYEFYDPAAPPTSLDPLICHRKRYTCNTELSQSKKVIDVIYDQVGPTFGLFFRWNTKGQIVIDSERPADWTKLRIASEVGANDLIVNDVLPWKNRLGSKYLLEGELHIGGVLSEVRPIDEAVYSDLGDEITLAASASGGPTAIASGATLSGGSPTVKSSATVTIGGSLTSGASITVTIDSIACVLDLVPGETSTTIGHRMACVINAEPIIREYVEAHAADNVVTIYSKIGVLTLGIELDKEHEEGTELTRVLGSFAGRALRYANTTRANILDGTFEWPEASRQPVINQIKAKHREAIQDFGEFPIVVNDDQHQEDYVKVSPFEPDHSAIDNYNTNARRCNSLLNKFRAGDKFFKLGSTGRALLLDEGDVICASDDSGNYRNVLMRIEDATIRNSVEIFFVSRLYSRDQFSDLVPDPVDASLESGLPGESPPGDIAFDEVTFPPRGLTQSTDGAAGITSVRGGVIFPAKIATREIQYAKIRLILRGGVVVDESINAKLPPNEDGKGVFEFLASVDGLYMVEAVACNQWGCSTPVTASIIIGFGSTFALARETGFALLRENAGILEREH